MCEVINHRLSTRNDLFKMSIDKSLYQEKRSMSQILLKAVDGLISNHIYTFQEIIKTFQRNHFNGSGFFSDVIIAMKEKIINELKYDVKWIKRRAVNKGKLEDKNIILCFLLYNFGDNFIKYLQDYLLKNKHNEEDIRGLISELKSYIKDAPNNTNKFLPPNLENEENNVDDQNNEIEIASQKNSLNEDNNADDQNDEDNNVDGQNDEDNNVDGQNDEDNNADDQNDEDNNVDGQNDEISFFQPFPNDDQNDEISFFQPFPNDDQYFNDELTPFDGYSDYYYEL